MIRNDSSEESFSFGKMILSGLKTFICVLLAWGLLNCFFQFSRVIGGSMKDTLQPGDLLLGIRARYIDIRKGDIVLAKKDGKTVIKRLIGLSGDKVEITEEGLFVNGEPVETGDAGSEDNIFGEWNIEEGKAFLLGDNRESSVDSRTYGEIPVSDITGKVIFRYYPLRSVGGL